MHSTVLANGLQAAVVDCPYSPITNVGIFVRQGSRNETEEHNGISHFLEHMLCNTQRALAKNKTYVEQILNQGGIINATTTKECTMYECSALTERLPTMLQALYQLVFEPDFSHEDVEVERKVILAELGRKLSGSSQLIEHLVSGIYSKEGYGRWVLGTEKFISTVTPSDLQQYYDAHYVADNISLVVMTNMSANEVLLKIQDVYQKVPSGVPNPIEISMFEQVHMKLLRNKSSAQVSFCMGGPAPSIRDEISSQFELSIATWGSVPNNRLLVAAREERGLVYSIQSFYHPYVQTGQWGISASVEKSNFIELMTVLSEQLNLLCTKQLSEGELSRTTLILKTDLYKKMQQQDFSLKMLGKNAIFRGVTHPNDILRQYALATAESVGSIIQKHISPKALSIVLMGDIDSDTVLKCMTKLGETLNG